MNKELQEKLPYYPTDLKAIHNGKEVSIRSITKKVGGDVLCGYDVLGDTSPWKSQGGNDFVDAFKFHLRPLTSLAKPITVKGYNNNEAFVPMEHLAKLFQITGEVQDGVFGWNVATGGDDYQDYYLHFKDGKLMQCDEDGQPYGWMEYCSFEMYELLFRWHFWIGDQSLFESGDLIEIKD